MILFDLSKRQEQKQRKLSGDQRWLEAQRCYIYSGQLFFLPEEWSLFAVSSTILPRVNTTNETCWSFIRTSLGSCVEVSLSLTEQRHDLIPQLKRFDTRLGSLSKRTLRTKGLTAKFCTKWRVAINETNLLFGPISGTIDPKYEANSKKKRKPLSF